MGGASPLKNGPVQAFYASIFPDSRVDRVTPLLSESPSGPAGSVNAMLKMVKLDIAKLQAAYDGKS